MSRWLHWDWSQGENSFIRLWKVNSETRLGKHLLWRRGAGNKSRLTQVKEDIFKPCSFGKCQFPTSPEYLQTLFIPFDTVDLLPCKLVITNQIHIFTNLRKSSLYTIVNIKNRLSYLWVQWNNQIFYMNILNFSSWKNEGTQKNEN